MKEHSTLIDGYAEWLKDAIEVNFTPDDLDLPILEEYERSFIVDVPFLDRHNDWLSFCVDISETDLTITLSDLGHMRNDEADDEKLMDTEAINSICRGLGVTNGECLEKRCTADDFPMAFSMFCTCLVKVSAALEVLENMEAAEWMLMAYIGPEKWICKDCVESNHFYKRWYEDGCAHGEHVKIHMRNVLNMLPILEQKFSDGYGKYNGIQHDEQHSDDIQHVLKEHVEPKMLLANNSEDNNVKVDCIISAIGSLCALYGRIVQSKNHPECKNAEFIEKNQS